MNDVQLSAIRELPVVCLAYKGFDVADSRKTIGEAFRWGCLGIRNALSNISFRDFMQCFRTKMRVAPKHFPILVACNKRNLLD